MNPKCFATFAAVSLAALAFSPAAHAQVAAPAAPAAAAPYYGPGYVPPPPPPMMLGINMDAYYIPGLGAETGLRVMNVWPGYPAYGVLDPGDIITRVNGMRVRSVPEFRHAMTHAGPYVNLRLWNVRTGYIHDIAPIYLGGPGYGYPAAAAPAATPAAEAPSAVAPTAAAPAGGVAP